MERFPTKKEIHNRALALVGIPFGSLDQGRLSTGKGGIGTLVEENWFGLTPNSKPQADFFAAGVELKVTPYRKNKNGTYSAKERLVLNIINYRDECRRTFETSSFLEKSSTMEILFYQHLEHLPRSQWMVDYAILFAFPEQDLKIIRDDWHTIVNHIRAGKAHELSEGMTDYLGASTKGASAKSVREQPFSEILASQRAFCLKNSYMTRLLRNYVMGEKTSESIVTHAFARHQTMEEYIINRVEPFVGKSQWQIMQAFPETLGKVSPHGKNLNNSLLSAILGIRGKAQNTDEFLKAGIQPKTITLNHWGETRESMSFSGFRAMDLVEETWEESSWHQLFEITRFLFVVFGETEEIKDRKSQHKLEHTVLRKIQFWNMPLSDVEGGLQRDWQKIVDVLRNGVVEEKRGSRFYNNLPTQKDTEICHIRPHARKRATRSTDGNADLLPTGGFITKQSFWLNQAYVLRQIIGDAQNSLESSEIPEQMTLE